MVGVRGLLTPPSNLDRAGYSSPARPGTERWRATHAPYCVLVAINTVLQYAIVWIHLTYR
jgi:hypothetical protein